MILLARDTGAARVPDADEGALCVRHPAYAAPATGPRCRHLRWEEFRADPRGLARDARTLVVVGLNQIAHPGTRGEDVFEFLYLGCPHLRKVSVDRTLFVVEPWRAWFHFGLVGAPYPPYTYSYLAESHWRAFREGKRPADPFSLAALVAAGTGIVRSDHARFFDAVEVERVDLPPAVHAAYQAEKARAFEDERTPAALVRRLAAFAQAACPRRAVPAPGAIFGPAGGLFGPALRIVRTDLRVDDHLVGWLLELAGLADAVAGAFYAG